MISGSPLIPKKNWGLTQHAFDRLLACLDPNAERAGEIHEKIRQKLTKLFKWRGCAFPEEYVDKTIDRVARKIEEGTEIRPSNPYLYFHGVALNVLREYWRKPARETQSFEDLQPSQLPSEDPEIANEIREEQQQTEHRLECMNRCLEGLSSMNRDIVLRYHQGVQRAKIDNRNNLAEQLKIPLSTLRIKVFRIRATLATCVKKCLGSITE
jgi:DNA-directed RNA polymerase specialized sigma24 family protein